jgi:RimJ/RimL family protein N-acetyltransferase
MSKTFLPRRWNAAPAAGKVNGRSWSVRRASEDDIDEILRLLGPVAQEGRWLLTPSAEEFARQRPRFIESVLRTDVGMFVVLAGQEIVGELSLIPEAPGLFGLGMVVARSWRGMGAGSALMSAAIAWARESGAHKIVLEVFPHNEQREHSTKNSAFGMKVIENATTAVQAASYGMRSPWVCYCSRLRSRAPIPPNGGFAPPGRAI